MKLGQIPIAIVTAVTLASGAIDILSAIRPPSHYVPVMVQNVLPFEITHVAKIVSVLVGFALAISAINIAKRKKRAFYIVLTLSVFSTVYHLVRGSHLGEVAVSLALVALLLLSRSRFTVRSGVPEISSAVASVLIMVGLTVAYGIGGFWFLDRRDFGINFRIGDAIRETIRYLGFAADPALVPHTRHAHFFMDSLYVTTVAAIAYSFYSLFRPALYRFNTLPHERALAGKIIETHGKSSIDFFKLWPDKSYFILPSRQTFVAYRVSGYFAIALGDPVGPAGEMESAICGFADYCRENDWGVGFHQTLPDLLPTYEKSGFHRLKLGDDAIVDLANFSLEGAHRRSLRHVIAKMEEAHTQFRWYEPPLADDVLAQAEAVSRAWLGSRGRRERQFTLGIFRASYVRSTPLAAALDSAGNMLAFANQIPSYAPGEATADLMRFIPSAPAGVMDYLFAMMFIRLKEKGYARFNLGLAPMSGFAPGENPSVEEKAIHFFFQQMNFLFSFRGLKMYKAKFASSWEPRYSVYRTPIDLFRMGLALRDVSEIKRVGRRKTEVTPTEERADEMLLHNP